MNQLYVNMPARKLRCHSVGQTVLGSGLSGPVHKVTDLIKLKLHFSKPLHIRLRQKEPSPCTGCPSGTGFMQRGGFRMLSRLKLKVPALLQGCPWGIPRGISMLCEDFQHPWGCAATGQTQTVGHTHVKAGLGLGVGSTGQREFQVSCPDRCSLLTIGN